MFFYFRNDCADEYQTPGLRSSLFGAVSRARAILQTKQPAAHEPRSFGSINPRSLKLPSAGRWQSTKVAANAEVTETGFVNVTPSPPTKSFPTNGPRVKLSGGLPVKLYGHENSHPLELRVCSSETLRSPNS